MSPGINTGWPTSRYADGMSWDPGGKARVAPLRCTHTVSSCSLILWRSNLAMLWQTSYTSRNPSSFGLMFNASRKARSARLIITWRLAQA